MRPASARVPTRRAKYLLYLNGIFKDKNTVECVIYLTLEVVEENEKGLRPRSRKIFWKMSISVSILADRHNIILLGISRSVNVCIDYTVFGSVLSYLSHKSSNK